MSCDWFPKGRKPILPQDYFIGAETKRLLVRVAQMLGEHYQLQPGEALPTVDFSAVQRPRPAGSGRQPYLFQYGRRHLSDHTITSCMRFLLHGMVFRTREGKVVVLKAHLLRHAFATHAVQVEKIPIDVVGAGCTRRIWRSPTTILSPPRAWSRRPRTCFCRELPPRSM